MTALLEKTVQVFLSFGREPLDLFARNQSAAISFIDPSAYSIEELIDELIEKRYKLVEARTFRDPSNTGDVRLKFFNEETDRPCLDHMAYSLAVLRVMLGIPHAKQVRFEPFRKKGRQTGAFLLRVHVMPRRTLAVLPEPDQPDLYVASATG